MQRSRLSKIYLFWALGCLVLVGAVVLVVYLQSDTRERAAERFVSYLRTQDWGRIYDQAPEHELKQYGVTREQYVAYVGSIAAGLPAEGWPDFHLDPRDPEAPAAEQKNVYTVMLRFPFASRRSDIPEKSLIHVHHTRDGWRVSPAGVPTRLASLQSKDRREAYVILRTALDAAGLESIPVNVDQTVLFRDGLDLFLAGKGDQSVIYRWR